MDHHLFRDHATSNVLAWASTHSANVEPCMEEDAGADTDEPPDNRSPLSPVPTQFQRAPIRRPSEHQESLLTKALQGQPDEDVSCGPEYPRQRQRRRSVTSSTSFDSAAELTCATGITTPARTSSPSPRQRSIGFAPLAVPAPQAVQRNLETAVRTLEKKRCISFACAAKPAPVDKAPVQQQQQPRADAGEAKTQAPPKKTSIRFACPAPPRATDVSQGNAPQRPAVRCITPSTPKTSANSQKLRSPSVTRVPRSPTARKTAGSPVAIRNKKWISADSKDLESEAARFHEFASDEPQEDDWIRRGYSLLQPKLTIDDTLRKELAIRKLGKEAEEEAELEEELAEDLGEEEDDEEIDEADLVDEDDDDDGNDDEEDADDSGAEEDEDEEEIENEDDAGTEHAWNSDASDGYKTDSEIGFAESDDDDDDLVLWTTRIGKYPLSGAVVMARRLSHSENSDSSSSSNRKRRRRKRRSKASPVACRPATPELPDSTDFVCGTLDEDKPLEEAYISCVEARKRERQRTLPQDIDPSFPTSEPEDEGDEPYRRGYGDSDEHVWLHGELEDLHHDRDLRGRKKKGGVPSPMRCRSPPPKLLRGRSPRRPSVQWSPRLRSPAPVRRSPLLSPMHGGNGMPFNPLTVGLGLTQTKSLPRTSVMFPHLKTRKPKAGGATHHDGHNHVRGAIDIVMGLEQKRQRRKEKYFQKYYSRARKEKAQPKRPPPGQGAERMRELGLLMASKVGHGDYVISI
ncbi:hypothetical protein VTJ83DRAFT_1018 [Remersonia thermophila]|uniref:Uncharacterized protein n=1 Tax=Remersonia thermophila TaxID=72144 RepID=A0ABR4DN43_9PEZI